MTAYPAPLQHIGDAYNFEDQLEALFNTILTNDSYLSGQNVTIYTRRSTSIQVTPRVELDVDMSSDAGYLSFATAGSPLRQDPAGFKGNVTMRVVTTRSVDSNLTTPLHGKIRGRCRYLLSAWPNLITALGTYQYLQILELLPTTATMDVQAEKDTDTTFLSYRMTFNINDWTYPCFGEEPASVSVTHPTGTVFDPIVYPPKAGSTYQWQVSTNSGGSWSNTTDGGTYTGSTTSTLTISATTTGMNGYQYRLVITTTAYSSTQTSSAATLTVS